MIRQCKPSLQLPSNVAAGDRGRRPAAFTLIELLVVIGVIAGLVSFLLPALVSVRHQSQTAICLSNMRQLGVGHSLYQSRFNLHNVPEGYRDFSQGTTANGYPISDSWATIFVATGVVPYPTINSTNPLANDPINEPTVFRCPSGIAEVRSNTSITSGQPTSRTDGMGSFGTKISSNGLIKGRTLYSWYATNSTSSSNSWSPIQCYPGDGGTVSDLTTAKFPRINQIRKPASLVFLFDGIGGNIQIQNANRLNARHEKNTKTNILFFDGHAESFRTADLPGGIGDAGTTSSGATTTFGLTNLKKYAYPKWRMDQ